MNKALLIYGNDIGLINKTIDHIKKHNTEIQHPFGYLEITNNNLDTNHYYLMEESLAITLTGKNRLIHIHEPNVNSNKIIQTWLKEYQGKNKLVISFYETPPLAIKNSLEKNANVTTTKCYVGNKIRIEQEILGILKLHNIKIDTQGLELLYNLLGNDTQITHSEVEKLITYHLPSQIPITSQEVIKCIVNNKQHNFDDATYNAADGKKNIDIKNYDPVMIIGITLQHFNKLYLCSDNKNNIDKIKPPLHFSRKKTFSDQLQKWNTNQILTAIDILIQAEQNMKNNYHLAKIICLNTLHQIAKIIS